MTQIGEKARSWRIWKRPSRTISSEAEKVEARTVRAVVGSTQNCNRKSSSTVHSCAVPASLSSASRASAKDQTLRWRSVTLEICAFLAFGRA